MSESLPRNPKIPTNPKVIVTRRLPEPIEARLSELFDTELNRTDRPLSQTDLAHALREADVLVPTVTDRIDSRLLAQAGERLKLIAQFGTGTDNIDVESAVSRGITVTNTPSVLTQDTADMTMALILAVPRRVAEGARYLRDRAPMWTGWSPTWMLGHRVSGKKLGIIGMGRIGQAVARRARACGLEIHYHNRNRVPEAIEQELDATYWDSLDRMLAQTDILSINCPHTPATFHLLNERRIRLMKPEAYIVNTSRGEVIDEEALAASLEQGLIAGAALDVFEHEPAVNPRLLNLDNVVLLPHLGSATIEGRMEMGERVLINIRTWMDGHKPPDRVIPAIL